MADHLTDDLVRNLPSPAAGNKVVYDDEVPGFGIRITAKGAKAFVLTYRFSGGHEPGRRSDQYRHTIGRYPAWSVAAARKEAKELRRNIDRGTVNPLAERRATRAGDRAARQGETFEEAVKDYITREQKGRRQNRTADAVQQALLRWGGVWLKRPLAGITPSEIRKQLETIRDGDPNKQIEAKPYAANRAFAYLSAFYGWACEPGIDKVPASPMEKLRRPWEGEKARERHYSDDEIKAIWKAADEIGGTAGAFVKLAVLSGKRKGALSEMRWSEIGKDWIWTPPSDGRRTSKNKRTHALPLPPLAQRILLPLRPDDPSPGAYVFPGKTSGSHLTPGSQLASLVKEKSGVLDFMFHAARHTCETKLAELGVPPHVRDAALDHVGQRGSGKGYDHHDYLAEIRDAMTLWANRVEKLVSPQGVAVLR